MPNIITVQHEVSDQFLIDIMTNAVESAGMSYWADVQLVQRNLDGDIIEFQVADAEDIAEAVQGLTGPPTPLEKLLTDSDLWYVIDKDAIMRGITSVLSGKSKEHGDCKVTVDSDIVAMIARAVSDNDADVDSVGCDVIVQVAMYGEVVFG
jgi:hypothetical protein